MTELPTLTDARVRIARLGLEDGLVALFFGPFLLVNGGLDLIGHTVPRETLRFDFFNLGFLQVAFSVALLIGVQRARSKLVVPRVGFVAPRPRKGYRFLGIVLSIGVLIPFLFMTAWTRDHLWIIAKFAGVSMAALFAAMFILMGVSAKLPRMIWLGAVLLAIGAWGYWLGASNNLMRVVLGAAATFVGALQFGSFLKAHPIAEPVND